MTDILLNNSGDLMIKDGDIVIGNSDDQNKIFIVKLKKGSLAQFPDVGAGITNDLKNDEVEPIRVEVIQQLVKEGMNVKKVNYDIVTGKLLIDASYR